MQRIRRDDGAVAVIVAILLVVLLGFGTLVLDVGQIYAERRQLQNGADAAVLALALDCPTAAGCSTDTSTTGLAGVKANQNANDGAATIMGICGNAPTLAPCSPPADIGPWDCRPVPPALASANYVQVRTNTRASGGGNLVPPFLARVLVPGYTGSTVAACARASWGAPTGLTSQLPITISLCEFQAYTSAGFAPPPPYPANYAGEKTLYFHNQTTEAPPCPAGPSGADLPGGFGWLDTTENCVATTDTTNWVDDSTGAPAPVECSNAELLAMRGQIIDVPIFDNTNGLTGATGEYHIVGYAAFYLTGYVFPGSTEKSLLTGNFPCGPPDHCISGVFTKDLSPTAGTIGTGPSMGVTVIQMSG
jgi:Flp pilus assembly protein TadG